MVLNKQETRALYRKRARGYDAAMWLYRAAGFRVEHYRRATIDALGLKRGDTIVELGCGTGLNFPLMENKVGEKGQIIGVDMSEAMLAKAEKRVSSAGWENVVLVNSDIAEYKVPVGAAGIVSSLAITLVPEYDEVIRKGSEVLKPLGRFAVLDFKEPENWPKWLIRFAAWVNKPYGVSMELANRKPMESIRKYLTEVVFREFYFGAIYLSVGEASDPRQN